MVLNYRQHEYLRRYFASHGASIVVARQPAIRSMQDELVEDLIAIVTSFSGRVHGMRGTHGKRVPCPATDVDTESKAIAREVTVAIDAAINAVVHCIVHHSEILRSPSG